MSHFIVVGKDRQGRKSPLDFSMQTKVETKEQETLMSRTLLSSYVLMIWQIRPAFQHL